VAQIRTSLVWSYITPERQQSARGQGYFGDDPWSEHVISAVDAQGRVVSSWQMRHCGLPARVREAHSETAYMTDQAIAYQQRMGERPWVLHLSYVKPHWPYMAPAPYHAMYRAEQCLPVVRSHDELRDAHPVVAAYRQRRSASAFRTTTASAPCVRPTRAWISQLDHHLGRLFEHMDAGGLLDDTFIVFTADHGDFLGDHWLGEKELFNDTVQKLPFIAVDPRREADATRGTVEQRFVESVDLVPTVLELLDLEAPSHRLEGRSLLPLLHGHAPEDWRSFADSELDYSYRGARLALGKDVHQCHAFSLRTPRWRYVFWLDEREQLFDLEADPDELRDLGRDASCAAVRATLRDQLLDFLARRRHRSTVSDAMVEHGTNADKQAGVFFGQW
jgi:arylsulfatase A-like enzyme